jgi:cyclase
MTHHLRVLEPSPGVLAFYDGRFDGYRFAAGPNWVDDGALEFGIASYAIIDGGEALVYDTSVSVEHAEFIRAELGRRGAERFTVVLSHWHLDHVAGTAAFADCEIVANERTAEHLSAQRDAIEGGTLEGPPAIAPLVLPTRTFSGRAVLSVGDTTVELIEANIHSDDATVPWLPERRLLLCADTMEDTVTYVDEPDQFDAHLRDLERLRDLELRDAPLGELIADSLAADHLTYYEPYEAVHRQNVATVLGVYRRCSARALPRFALDSDSSVV